MPRSFAEILKDQPNVEDVHVPSTGKKKPRKFFEVIGKEANPISDPQPYVYGTGGKRRARTYSQVIAEATRGVDAGMNRFTPPTRSEMGMQGHNQAPDWRGHYLGKLAGKLMKWAVAGLPHPHAGLATGRKAKKPTVKPTTGAHPKAKTPFRRGNQGANIRAELFRGVRPSSGSKPPAHTAPARAIGTHKADFNAVLKALKLQKYSEDQPRDAHGMWTAGGVALKESGGSAAPAMGEHFLVYRAGAANETNLAGRNAGSSDGVAEHLARLDDAMTPRYQGQSTQPTTVHAFDVVATAPMGAYQTRPGIATAVGRRADGGGRAVYSFGSSGYQATHLGSAPLSSIRSAIAGGSFDEAGTNAGAHAIRSATYSKAAKAVDFLKVLNARHLEKYSDDEPRDEKGRWTAGGGGGATQAAGGGGHHLGPTDNNHAQQLFAAHDNGATAAHVLAAAPAGTAEKIAATEHALSQATPTDALVSAGGFKNPDGTWTAERQALHEQILSTVFSPTAVANATPAPGEQPTITFLGGRGGSGKTWLTGPQGPVNATTSIVLNSDHFKEALPGYAGWNAALYHEEATSILGQADKIAQSAGVNVVYDATMKSESGSAQRLLEFQNAGFKAEGHYMFTSPQESATRAVERFTRGGATGRYVPINVLLGNRTNEKTFDTLKPSFSKWTIYSNEARGGTPKLIASGGR